MTAIENILRGEQKRRLDSNEIMSSYITEYLDKLQAGLEERVGA